jgi:hypothetical protein
VSIDKTAIEKFMRELQAEFDKYPIQMPVNAEHPELNLPAATIYNGPVFYGNAEGAQVAWGNSSVVQNSSKKPVAEGYETLAESVVDILRQLPAAGLDPEDDELANESSEAILAAVTEASPDRGTIKRSVALLTGVLTRLALAGQSGANAAVTDWAHQSVAHLTSLI